MNTPDKISSKRLAWIAATLCIACCAVTPLLLLIGISSAAGLAIYFEYAALGFFIASLIIMSYLLFKNNKQSCKTNCSCKELAD